MKEKLTSMYKKIPQQFEFNYNALLKTLLLKDYAFFIALSILLVAFLEVLTDPCIENRECLGKWIPDASDTNPDALRVNAIDGDGEYL